MTQIINWLLVYIKLQEKIIVFLFVLLTCKNITPKDDTPISKKYRYLQVDELPIFETFKKLDYKKLLQNYQDIHGKELKPINRHKNSVNKVPDTIKCPRCNAPHQYLYDNNGGKGQFLCKVCDFTFEANKVYLKSIKFKCPHCNRALQKIKNRKDFNIYKCKNDYCSFYQYNLVKMTKDEKKLFKTKPSKFKLHYIYREFKCDFTPLSKKSPVIPKVDLSRIYSSPHTLGLVLTYYANYGISARKVEGIMKDIHNIDISHQTVLNYVDAVSKYIKPYIDNYPYKLSNSFCGDETYLKIKGKWQYLFFFFDAVKKIILSYRISPDRDTLSAIKALDDALQKIKNIDQGLTFVVDGNPIYLLAQQYFAQNGINFDIKQVIGLTNLDPISKEYRPLKQIVERLNRTFKREYKNKYGFNSSAGSEAFTILFVAYFNFLRPHSALEDKRVPVIIPELENIPNMPGKWITLISLAQEYIEGIKAS